MPKETTLRHTQLITVFAFHPIQRILAAGDVTGRVLIWKDIGNGELTSVKTEDDPESCTAFNWHSAEVTVLNFSSDGALLYSGETELISLHSCVDNVFMFLLYIEFLC